MMESYPWWNDLDFGEPTLHHGMTTVSVAGGLALLVFHVTPSRFFRLHREVDAIIDPLYEDTASLPVYRGWVIHTGANTYCGFPHLR
jgi:hypothetical protein